jgi:hypothetical protein
VGEEEKDVVSIVLTMAGRALFHGLRSALGKIQPYDERGVDRRAGDEPAGMTTLHHILGRARRRAGLNLALSGAAAGLTIGAGLALTLVLIERSTGLAAPRGLDIAMIAGAMLAGTVICVRQRPGRMDVAIAVDRQWRLQDRISTVEAIESGRLSTASDAGFIELVRRDAEQVAAKLHLPAIAPIRWGRAWGAAALLLAAYAMAVTMLPVLPWAARGGPKHAAPNTPIPEEFVRQREQAAGAVRDAASELRSQTIAADLPELQTLDRLAAQLADDTIDENALDRAKQDAAEALADAADRLERSADRDAEMMENLVERFRGLDAPASPLSTDELVEAIRRGDLGDAAQRLDDLERGGSAMSEAERRSAAESLRTVADRLSHQDAVASEPHALKDALQAHGMQEQEIDALLDRPDSEPPADSRRELEERAIDPELAERLARDLQGARATREAERHAGDQASRLEESLRDLAERLERADPPRPEPAPASNASEPPPSPDRAATSDRRTPPQQEPSDPQQEPASEDERPVVQPPSEAPDRTESAPTPSPAPPQRDSRTPSSEPVGSTGNAPPAAAPAGDQTIGRSDSMNDRGAADRPASEPDVPREAGPDAAAPRDAADRLAPGADRSPETTAAPPREPTDRERASSEAGETAPEHRAPGAAGPDGKEPPSAAEPLRELARVRETISRNRDLADRLRRRAAELADTMDDAEKERWARQWKRQFGDEFPPLLGDPGSDAGDEPAASRTASASTRPPAFESENLDLSGGDPADRIIAEWMSDETRPPAVAPPAKSSEARVRDAQRIAERAVNESAVPARYRGLIQRYFDRLDETVDRAARPRNGGGTAP